MDEYCGVAGCGERTDNVIVFEGGRPRSYCRNHFRLEDYIHKATNSTIMRKLLEIEKKVDAIRDHLPDNWDLTDAE